MRFYRLERDQLIPRPLAETFAFYADALNLEAITPPWLRFHVLNPSPLTMQAGARIEYRLRWRGVPLRWLTRIEEWQEGRSFVDAQVRGPYRLWVHRHTFEAVRGGTRVRDFVTYALPFGPLGTAMHRLLVGPDLERIFDYRATRVAEILGDGRPWPAVSTRREQEYQ